MKSVFTILSCVATISLAAQSTTAEQYFAKGLEEKSKKANLRATRYFDSAINVNPTYVAAIVELAKTHVEQKQYSMAIANYNKAEVIEPNEMAHKESLTNIYFKMCQFKKAMEYAEKCPNLPNRDKILGVSNYKDENYGEAIQYLSASYKKDSRDSEVAYYLAHAYSEIDNTKSATTYFEEALAADTTRGSWHQELGLMYFSLNRYADAARCFEHAMFNGVKVANDFKENLAFAYAYSGALEKADNLFFDLIARKNNNPEFIRDIAHAYYSAKRYDKGLEYCSIVLEKDKKEAKTLYLAGLCFIKKGDDSRGKSMCDAAIEMDPSLGRLKKQQSMDQFGL